MKFRPFGTTGVQLSMLGLGTMNMGSETDEAESLAMVRRCLDAGINHFDCANVYSGGRSEEILGRALKPVRDEVFLATKMGFPTGKGINERGASGYNVRASVEASLRRLDTDRIDLYYLHYYDWRTDVDDLLRSLDRLVASGKVLYLGVSNYAAWQIAVALGRAELLHLTPISAFQPMYNLVKRQVEVELLPMAKDLGLAAIPYGPLAGGLLTGKYRGDRSEVDGRLNKNEMYQKRYQADADFEVAQRLVALAEEVGVSPMTLAVAWSASHPQVTAPLIGGRSAEQLEPSLAAAEFEMDDDLRARVSELSPTPAPATDRSEAQI